MTLFTLAARNVRHQARSYVAFFLSSTFAVWLFYLYASLLLHPQFAGDRVPTTVKQVLLTVEVAVGVFAVLFTLYANSAFQKARQHERGLLALLGMQPGQMARTMLYENAIIGLGSTTVGIALGTVCAKFFFLAISPLVGITQRLSFAFSGRAVLITYAVFLGVFVLITLLQQRTLRRVSVAEVFRGARAAKAPPRFSLWLVALALACYGTAYGYGSTLTMSDLGKFFPFMFLLILVGTYLLFTQVSVAALSWLQRRPSLYWHPTRLFSVSQLVYKVRDNALVLFMVSILSALSLLFVGLFYSGLSTVAENAPPIFPVGMSIEGVVPGVGPQQVDAVLQRHGLAVAGRAQVTVLHVSSPRAGALASQPMPGREWVILSRSDADRWFPQVLQRESVPAFGRGLWVVAHEDAGYPDPAATTVPLLLGTRVEEIPIAGRTSGVALNGTGLSAVVDDATFAELRASLAEKAIVPTYGVNLPDWVQSGPAYHELKAAVEEAIPSLRGSKRPGPLTATYLFYEEQRLSFGLLFFLAVFVGLLFFLAAGNMLYFKVFTDLAADRTQFQALYKLGLDAAGVRRIVAAQMRVVFFAPLAVALIHASALPLMATVKTHQVSWLSWQAVLTVMLVYVLLHTGYYLITRRAYVRALLERQVAG